MSAGHMGLVGGHFSHNRASHLKLSFTWQGLERDVREFCATCPECQKAGRPLLPRVTMIETPIISVPYHHMAFDIVGPLKRTKRGLFSHTDSNVHRNPLPLLCAYTGIPVELLTDQGAVFVGKVCSELCRLLNIKHITTTAYHPQSNGALERWHGCLKDMLRKLEGRLEQWDLLLKYCLLAY